MSSASNIDPQQCGSAPIGEDERGGMSVDQLGQRARELLGRQVIPGAELQSLDRRVSKRRG